MQKHHFTVVYEKQPEGGYVASVPALPGCHSEGRNFEEAQEMVVDAIRSYLASLVKHGEPIPASAFTSQLVSQVEVTLETA